MANSKSSDGGATISLSMSFLLFFLIVVIIVLYYFRCDVFKSGCDECKWNIFGIKSGCPDSPSAEDSTSADSAGSDSTSASTSTSATPPPGSSTSATPPPPPPSGNTSLNGHTFSIDRSKYSIGRGYIWSSENLGMAPFNTTSASECETSCTGATDHTWCEHWTRDVSTGDCFLKNNKIEEKTTIRGIKKSKFPANIDPTSALTVTSSDPGDCMKNCESSNQCVAWVHKDDKYATVSQRNTCDLLATRSGAQFDEGFSANTPWIDSPWSHSDTNYLTLNHFDYNTAVAVSATFTTQREAEMYCDSHPEISGYVTDGTSYWCKAKFQTTNSLASTVTSYIKKSWLTPPESSDSSSVTKYFRIRNEATGKYFTAPSSEESHIKLDVLNTSDDHQLFAYYPTSKEIVPKSYIRGAINLDQGNIGGGSIKLYHRDNTNQDNKFEFTADGNFNIKVTKGGGVIRVNPGNTSEMLSGGTTNNRDTSGSSYSWTKDNIFFIEPI